jgi:hypothetical protein
VVAASNLRLGRTCIAFSGPLHSRAEIAVFQLLGVSLLQHTWPHEDALQSRYGWENESGTIDDSEQGE